MLGLCYVLWVYVMFSHCIWAGLAWFVRQRSECQSLYIVQCSYQIFMAPSDAKHTVIHSFLTWNVRGLGNPIKRHRVHSYLNRRGIHVAILQETHLTAVEGARLQRRWRGQLFYTTFSAFSRGVLVWIKPTVPFQMEYCKTDPDGRYVYLQGRLDGSPISILGLYAPNTGQIAFLHTLDHFITSSLDTPLIVGGDFNSVCDVNMDRSHPPLLGAQAHKIALGLTSWTLNWQMADVWRVTHPLEREYSHFSHIHALHTRIDMFLVSAHLLTLTHHTELLARTKIGERRVGKECRL